MIILQAIKKLFPKGKAFKDFTGCLLALLGGCADGLEDVKLFLKELGAESLPNTATDISIEEWIETLGVYKPGGISLEEKRKKTTGRYRALVGGQDINYLQELIDSAYDDILIEEILPPTGQYKVIGSVSNPVDYIRMQGLIETIMPGYLEPVYFIDILSEGDEGIVGLAVVNLARVNKT